jgi:hypothetical protein
VTEIDRLRQRQARGHETLLVDEQGRRTDDPARAVRGEIVDVDASGRTRRVWFLTSQAKLDWLPVEESAFLLWVLVGLLGLWLLIGVALGLI